MRTLATLLPLTLLLSACGGEPATGGESAIHQQSAAHAIWQANPTEGVQLGASAAALEVRTGPHTVLWQSGAAPLAPPYTVEATLQKRSGRLHEGYGLIFGGEGLAAPEAGQHYSYFLVRGDGSYLIKRREGAEMPIVRDWTANRAVRRDVQGAGEPNHLRVVVGTEEVVFSINGQEVARIPSSDLRTRGVAGLRVAHNVELRITDFTAAPTTP